MALKLNEDVVTHVKPHPPLRDQLAAHIRQAIATGDLQPGDVIPSEPKIAELTRINRSTVRFALSLLADEGLIRRGHGKPTTVAQPASVRTLNTSRYSEELTRLRAGEPPETAFVTDHGADWEQYTCNPIEYSEEPANDADAQYLGIKKGTRVMRRRMVKRLDGKPVQIQRSTLLARLAKGTVLADPKVQPYPGGTLAELHHSGLIPDEARLTVAETATSRPPNTTERRLLHMEVAGWVCDIVRVFVVDGVPVEVSRVITPANEIVIRYETDVN
jgi:GntR family transcriptional regulator